MLSVCKQRNEPFAVHVINSGVPLEFVLMRDATNLAKDFPVMLFCVANGRLVSARATIPTKYTADQFNAQIWLSQTIAAVKLPLRCAEVRKKTDCTVCNLMDVPDDVVVDATTLIALQTRAKEIAREYIPS